MEERTLRCPNCGANATNHDNCEYCGSLLVRFVEKGIDLSKTTYLNDDATFLGLTSALKNNLQLQESTDESVVTDIVGTNTFDKRKEFFACILRNGNARYLDGQSMPTKTHKGLCVSFAFHQATNGARGNYLSRKRLERFKLLDCFPLFTEHISYYDNNEWKANEYFIDFGEDAEGASRLISRILHEVYGLSLDGKIDCYTNAGQNIDKCRKGIEAEIEALERRKEAKANAIRAKEDEKRNEEIRNEAMSDAKKGITYAIIFFIVSMLLLYLLQ